MIGKPHTSDSGSKIVVFFFKFFYLSFFQMFSNRKAKLILWFESDYVLKLGDLITYVSTAVVQSS